MGTRVNENDRININDPDTFSLRDNGIEINEKGIKLLFREPKTVQI